MNATGVDFFNMRQDTNNALPPRKQSIDDEVAHPPPVKFMDSTNMNATMYSTMAKNEKKHIFQMDPKCMSCSG